MFKPSLIAFVFITAPAHALDLTPTAEVLAGQSTAPEAAGPEKAAVIASYTRKVAQLWDTFEAKIAGPMREWAKSELPRGPGETIFYPFAGPDFPTVQILYPDAARYVLVALQRGGRAPDMSGMSKDRLDAFLKVFRSGWESFTLRGFYDTVDLERDHAGPLEGITPALMAFAVRLGYTIERVEPVRIDASGADLELHPGDRAERATWDSVRLTLKAGGRTVLLDYVHLNLADAYLSKHDHARAWIESMAGQRVVTKAASHLMQKSFFSIIKSSILARAPSIWQDETGIDYGELAKAFSLTLYGKFTKANKLFLKDIQRSLAAAYESRHDIRPLPFKVGYKKESGSCVQVGIRSP